MKILITGATGLIGSALVKKLIAEGYQDFVFLTRNKDDLKKKFPFPCDVHLWRPTEELPPQAALENVDAIINLAGESVAEGFWNNKKKDRIYSSRIKGTQNLAEAYIRYPQLKKPEVFINASAIGLYGDRGDEILNENSSRGEGFLSHVCHDWEESLRKHAAFDSTTRKIYIRIGIVLARDGGALPQMLPPFMMGAGGKLGHGQQYMSWIHLDDLVQLFIWCLKNKNAQGVYNGVAPAPVTNLEFTKTLGSVLSRPTLFPVPKFVLKTIFGQKSEILLFGQRVHPQKSTSEGFKFQYPLLKDALKATLHPVINHENQLEVWQWVPQDRHEVFKFFSEAKNLQEITPPTLDFKITNQSTPHIQEGTLIDYKLKVHFIPMKWRTLIKEWTPQEKFMDVQLKGPYTKWEHTHRFYPFKGGTLVQDQIIYKLPMGCIGKIFGMPLVKKDLRHIFGFRQMKIEKIFK